MTAPLANLNLPPDLGPSLVPLNARRTSLDNEAQQYARDVQEGTRRILGAAAEFAAAWKAICQEVIAGRTAEAHGTRERFLAAFAARLDLLRQGAALARHAERVAGNALPESRLLDEDAASLERQLSKVASRWVSEEELEYLASESIVITKEKVVAIQKKHGFPQRWYDEESKPF